MKFLDFLTSLGPASRSMVSGGPGGFWPPQSQGGQRLSHPSASVATSLVGSGDHGYEAHVRLRQRSPRARRGIKIGTQFSPRCWKACIGRRWRPSSFEDLAQLVLRSVDLQAMSVAMRARLVHRRRDLVDRVGTSSLGVAAEV